MSARELGGCSVGDRCRLGSLACTGSGTGAGTGTSSATLSDGNRQAALPSDDGSDEEPGKQTRIEKNLNPYCDDCDFLK